MTDAPVSLPWIARLVSFDTTSRDSNLPLIETVAQELRSHGIEPQIFPNEDGTKANLVATIPAADGTRTGGVVLSGHTDVVPVDGQEWDSDPFELTERDGRLYGRGTCDMKSYLAVAIAALPQMVQARLREPIHFALTYDEEVGCLGGAHIVKQIADLGLAPRACIVGEPTTMEVITGHKSMSTVAVTFTGVSAHSSLTPNGLNAIEYAGAFIRFYRGMVESWRDEGPFDEAYPVPYTTGGVNVISGGIAVNTVPDHCRLEFDCRTIPSVSPDDVLAAVRDEAARLEDQMKRENGAGRVDVELLASVPAFESPENSSTVALAVALGVTESPERVTYGTEAGQFAGTGIDTIVCGPGDIAQAHRPNEFVEVSQIEECERFIARLIEELSVREVEA